MCNGTDVLLTKFDHWRVDNQSHLFPKCLTPGVCVANQTVGTCAGAHMVPHLVRLPQLPLFCPCCARSHFS